MNRDDLIALRATMDLMIPRDENGPVSPMEIEWEILRLKEIMVAIIDCVIQVTP